MEKFLTKQEIIDKLNSLPDLPVVYQLDCDDLRNSGVTQIEVIEAVLYDENRMEFHKIDEYLQEEQRQKAQKIILIS